MGRTLEYPKDARNTVNRLGKKRGKLCSYGPPSFTLHNHGWNGFPTRFRRMLVGVSIIDPGDVPVTATSSTLTLKNLQLTILQIGTYDLGTIHEIIQSSPVLHVSFSPAPSDPFPAILPMIGVMASYSHPSSDLDEPMDCYLHGYVSSRIMNLARGSSNAGVPVCVAATKVDGLVLSLTPNSHSYNYRSAVLFGHAVPVMDVEEKLWAMEKITNKVVSGRWEETRIPPNAAEMQSTQILKVVVQSGSGKIRDGPPGDEKGDLEDESLLNRTWTGFVPLKEVLCEPVPSKYNRVSEIPVHIKEYVKDFNEERDEYVQKVTGNVQGEMKMYGEL